MFDLIHQIQWRDHAFSLVRLAMSVVLLVGAIWFYFDNESEMENARRTYDSLQFSTEESEEFQQLLEANYDRYMDLVALGYVGTPRRLQWLESLRQLSHEHDIPGVEFTLEGSLFTEQYVDPFWHPEIRMRVSDMMISLQLTHEVDLYRLLVGLRQQAEGMFSVESCRLQWIESFAGDVALNRFRGDCQLKWFTLESTMSQTQLADGGDL